MTEYSCVPGYPGFRSFTVREDFRAITQNWANALILQCAEIKTNEVIAYFRAERELTETELPPEEDRWFDLSLHEAEAMTLSLQNYSTYSFTLRPTGRKSNDIPSLIQLGFLRSRWVARPYHEWPRSIATEVHRDIRGERYILVDDEEGYYLDFDGIIHKAIKEKFQVSRQFLLLIDQVNAVLKALKDDQYQSIHW